MPSLTILDLNKKPPRNLHAPGTTHDFLINDLIRTGLAADVQTAPFSPPVLGQNFAGDQFFTNGDLTIITLTSCKQKGARYLLK
ncbi:hypothetical protein COV06_00385 [Candidatus Uhrbacteria bacterium CG10_big_fil_rev_8_21_14_0_10_50_16]|uniref:Uncharacterized protein n=1 Tax=Candidatus Uhrbacteria bacterium CG10_big_fil_rev_8_21_14_0_10_50_16 TaxID=1975039 RepID=A0A2H0RN34_9BACT|nr:MAG: hypothetical protein COV06_00385 [Candidatus Uhrbacteria bacterium CG10_big_fil_rev_8_21_14_0_10_50_16]